VGHNDLCARKIVDYAMGERMTKNLDRESWLRAVETTKPSTGLLHHSDKVSQYCSYEYRRMLEGLEIKASMSATETALISLPWRVSGPRRTPSSSFIPCSPFDSQLFERLPSTLKCSKIDSGFKSTWTNRTRQLSNAGTANSAWQHDRLGVHC
jgi:hypothetical protein